MFSYMPFLPFAIISVIGTILLLISGIKYRKTKYRFCIPICITGVILGVLSIITKYFYEYSHNSIYYKIFTTILIISSILFLLTIIGTGIVRCKQGYIDPKKKKVIYICSVLLIVAILIVVTLIIIKKL